MGIKSELFDDTNIDQYDTVIFIKAYSAENIALAEKLKEKGKQIIFDICDNHSAIDTKASQHEDKVTRLNKMLSIADKVTVPTHELGVLLNTQDFLVVPDALENIKPTYPVSPLAIKNSFNRMWQRTLYRKPPLHLIWFGNAGAASPINGMYDLKRIENELLEVAKVVPFRLDVLSNCEATFKELFESSALNIHFKKWNQKCFKALMYNADISLIPVTENSVTRGKSANRVITSLLFDTPVIANRIVSYEPFEPFIHIENWTQNILSIYQAPDKEKQRTALGKAYIFEKYKAENLAKKWAEAINTP